jgi:hypothetical protein
MPPTGPERGSATRRSFAIPVQLNKWSGLLLDSCCGSQTRAPFQNTTEKY